MTALILDTETDALDAPRPIQVAYIDLQTKEKYNALFSTGRAICKASMAVHHISDADVKDKAVFNPSTLPEFAYLIGHNIDYDWRVIGSPECKRICTLALAKATFPDWSGYTQSACLYHILPAKKAKKLTKNAHNALADVEANWVLYKYLCSELGVLDGDFEALWLLSEEARIPKTMPFGKHRGCPMHELPADYISWALLNLTDIDDYLRLALEQAQSAQNQALFY